MKTKFQSEYLSVLEAATQDELQAEFVHFTRQLGFETFGAMAVVDHFLGGPEFISIDNSPVALRATLNDRDKGKQDPVLQHCKQKSVPIIWDQTTYTKVELGEMWEIQAHFGYRCGIALAMHMPEGRHFVLGVDRDQALPSSTAEITRMAAALQLFAVHAQEAAMRVLLPQARQEEELPSLTPRELECLRWTMEGKTAWELGRILGIAEQTAVRHVHNASKKLGCVNKHQAVLKALRMKLIW